MPNTQDGAQKRPNSRPPRPKIAESEHGDGKEKRSGIRPPTKTKKVPRNKNVTLWKTQTKLHNDPDKTGLKIRPRHTRELIKGSTTHAPGKGYNNHPGKQNPRPNERQKKKKIEKKHEGQHDPRQDQKSARTRTPAQGHAKDHYPWHN